MSELEQRVKDAERDKNDILEAINWIKKSIETNRKETQHLTDKLDKFLLMGTIKSGEEIKNVNDYCKKDSTSLLMVINSVLTLVVVILCIILLFKGGPTKNEERGDKNSPVQVVTPIVPSEQPKEVKSDTTEEQKAAEEKAAAEWKTAEDKKASERKAAAERKAAEEKAAAERKAAEWKTAENKKASERKAAEKAKQAEAEKAAAERKAAEEKPIISVEGDVKEIKNGKQYTFSVNYSGTGKWMMDGFELQEGTIHDKKIVVKARRPSNGTTHTISYFTRDGDKFLRRFESE